MPSPMPPMTPYPRYSSQSWPVAIPSAPTPNPAAQKHAAVNIAARGPLRSTHVPITAADRPSITIAIEKITPIWVRFASKCLTSAVLYTLVAYAWPMHRCTASAAGGISQRLKPGPATERSRESSPDTVVVMSTMSPPPAPARPSRASGRARVRPAVVLDATNGRPRPPGGHGGVSRPGRPAESAVRLLRSGKEDTDVDATPRRPRPRGRHPRHPLGVGRPACRGERWHACRRQRPPGRC